MMSTPPPKTASSATRSLLLVLLPLCVLPYAVMMSGISGLHDVDGISRGLAGFYALIAIVVLWILLAIVLVSAAIAGEMPGWARIAALVLHPLSIAATITALDLLDSVEYSWAIITPALLPPLLAGYGLWARLPKLHAILSPHSTSGTVWGLVALLSLVPVVGMVTRDRARDAHIKSIPFISEEQQRAEQRQQRIARFEQLTSASPLSDYLQYLGRSDKLRDHAIAAVRQLDQRQAQAETMLRQGFGIDIIRHIAELDLQATPQLCAAADAYLTKRAEDARPKGNDPSFWVIDDELETALPGFNWLVPRHCDMREALDAFEATVRAYPTSSYAGNAILADRRGGRLEALAELRRLSAR